MGTHLENTLISWIKPLLFGLVLIGPFCADWGFFGHRLINRQAVYILPYELRKTFIKEVEYLSAHAVDADKRRYATTTEAFQHYFDTEMWEPYLDDSTVYDRHDLIRQVPSWSYIVNTDTTWVERDSMPLNLLLEHVPRYFTGLEWEVGDTTFRDSMVHHGILPITLIRRYYALRSAFSRKDRKSILRHAADLGHYLADAHVPLHTTVNYNGQLTGQLGIHAFWETSIPELLAESDFSLITGKAEYIPDVKTFIWNVIRTTNMHVDAVLDVERELRASWPDDQEECPSQRNRQTVFQPCPELTKVYNRRLDGMVESQMQKAIKSIASLWWSAYVDAGQPNLSNWTKPEAQVSKPEKENSKESETCRSALEK